MTRIAPDWSFRVGRSGALATLCCASAAALAGGVPDVLGIKPGMTVDEAKALLSTQPQYRKLQVRSIQLAYTNSQGQTAPVPNAQTIGAIANIDSSSPEKIAVEFGNVPGKERVIGVARYSLYAGNSRPLEDALRKSLVEKYGKPAFVDELSKQVVIWSWDADGKPRGIPVRGGFTPCNGAIATLDASGGGAYGNWSLGVFRPVVEHERQRVSVSSLCGDMMVLARIVASEGFVNALHVQMVDHKGALAAREAAAKLIDAAAKAEMGDARKTAGKNAPKL